MLSLYALLLGVLMIAGLIVNAISRRPVMNGAKVASWLFAVIVVLRAIAIFRVLTALPPHVQGYILGAFMAEATLPLLAALYMSRRFAARHRVAPEAKLA